MPSALPFLFRSLIPTWNFFDQAGDSLSLRYRKSEKGSAWILAFQKPRFQMRQILQNPKGTALHFQQTLMQQLLHELKACEAEQVSKLTSFLLLDAWVQEQVRTLDYEWKISRKNGATLEDLFLFEGHDEN